MRKLVAAAIYLLSLSLSVTTGRCIKEARTRTGKKCCEQQLRTVDKALSRTGDIPEESWICLSRKNLILAQDKRCSCSSSWGHGKILSKRPGVRNKSSQIKNSQPSSQPHAGFLELNNAIPVQFLAHAQTFDRGGKRTKQEFH